MIFLIAAIILLSVSILVSRHYLLMKEWFLWASMMVGTFMRGQAESRKLKVLREAGGKRFPLTIKILPEALFAKFIHRVQMVLMDNDHTMKNYNLLIQGIALYNKDYSDLLQLIDREGKTEKA